jgi:hypothetical protein
VNDVIQQTIDRAQAALQKDPAHPENVAAQYNMQLVRADGYAVGDTIPGVPKSADFEQSVASLKKGDVSQPVAVSATKVAMAVAADVMPARPATLAEVESKVRDAVTAQKVEQLIGQRATELYQKAAQGDLAKAAQSMGLEAKTSEDFDRQGAVEGLGPASYVTEAFNKPAGSLLGPISIPDARVVAKVISHSPADMSNLAAQRNALRNELKTRKARQRSALFEAGLRQTLIQDGKIKIHQDVINRLTASNRGA